MRVFTIEQYLEMSKRFNKLSFEEKIKTIRKNRDVLTLVSDGNWWGVRAKDNDIQCQLDELDSNFSIEDEWDAREMCVLVFLLDIDNTDM
jgi:hypothetical protein